jgi:hypothetical protein
VTGFGIREIQAANGQSRVKITIHPTRINAVNMRG